MFNLYFHFFIVVLEAFAISLSKNIDYTILNLGTIDQESSIYTNFKQDRTQMKSPLEADRGLCMDKMEE